MIQRRVSWRFSKFSQRQKNRTFQWLVWIVQISVCLFLYSPFLESSEKPTIVLDGGHGGKDEGAKVVGIEEKKLTLRTAYLTKRYLEQMGYKVVLTRNKDVFVSLGRRVKIANRRASSLFLSIHYNSAKTPIANGIEMYYYGKAPHLRKEKSKKLAQTILREVIYQTHAESRGVKQGNFQVIRETIMPGVLIEAGFLTNKRERELLSTREYLNKLSKGIASGIDQYVREEAGHFSVL